MGSSAPSHSGSTSTSTRRSCMGRCPLPTTMTVSSSAISAASTPPTRRAKGRRRVRTWSTSRRGWAPTMARRRRPTGPSAPRPLGPDGGRTSVTSSRWRSPLPSAGRESLRVISSWRPRRRVRTTKPARAMRQSAVSRYESVNRRGVRAKAVTVPPSSVSTERVGRVANHRSTGRRSSASNCHSISTGSSARPCRFPGSRHRVEATATRRCDPGRSRPAHCHQWRQGRR